MDPEEACRLLQNYSRYLTHRTPHLGVAHWIRTWPVLRYIAQRRDRRCQESRFRKQARVLHLHRFGHRSQHRHRCTGQRRLSDSHTDPLHRHHRDQLDQRWRPRGNCRRYLLCHQRLRPVAAGY